jgi:tetratricopeptide (TPR) repeat protein
MSLDLNNIAPYFLIYAALFRLAIITAGVVSIVLGYRLFCKGIWRDTGNQSTAIDANIAGAKFTFKNAAPGTFFALFGVIIISVMFKGAPEFTYKMMTEEGQQTSPGTIEFTMRGDDTLEAQKCLDLHGKGESDQAIKACRQAMSKLTKPMYYLATIYKDQGKIAEAFPFAKMAVAINPQNTVYLDRLATILCQVDAQNDDSLRWMEKAIKREPNYEVFGKQLDKFKHNRCGPDK